MQGLKDQLAALQQQLEAQQIDAAAVKADYDQLKEQFETLNKQLADQGSSSQAAVGDLQQQLEAAKQLEAKLREEVAHLHQQVRANWGRGARKQWVLMSILLLIRHSCDCISLEPPICKLFSSYAITTEPKSWSPPHQMSRLFIFSFTYMVLLFIVFQESMHDWC